MRTTEFYQRCVIASLQAGDSAEVSSIRAKEAIDNYNKDIGLGEVSAEERISSTSMEFLKLISQSVSRLMESHVLRR